MALEMKSPAFKEGGKIPRQYSCEGSDISPALEWSVPPRGTQALALICDDPDAPGGTWVHWVVWNLPVNTLALQEAVPATPKLPNGAMQGLNDFRKVGWNGPCPPPGKPHRYVFKLYALDKKLDLPASTTKEKLVKEMHGHVLAQAELIGTYQRSKK